MAVQPTGSNGCVRLPFGKRTGWAETVSGTVRRSSPDGRLCGLRSDRRAEDGPRGLLVACGTIFSEAAQLNPQDPIATAIVARIDELFAIDAEARSQRLSLEARDALRQQQSRPLLGVIQKQIEAARSAALPGGSLAKACNYTLTMWQKLTRFLEYPELELSNNLAENSMRPVALGRRNWIHIGSAQAGPKIAAILSVVESCRRLKFPVRDYLAAVLPGLADLPIQRLPELTPAAWVAQRS